MPLSKMLTRYRRTGKHMRMARTSIRSIFMPTMDTILHMKTVPGIVSIRDAEEYVQQELVRYQNLFDKLSEFRATYQAFSPDNALGVMGSFVRVTPLAAKVGDMAFLCVCADAYQSYICVETIVLSMVFNPDLNVLDILR